MAKRRKTSTAIVRAIPVRTPAPIIRVSAPAPHKKKGHRRRHHSSNGGGLNQASMQSHAIGGFLYGVIEKNFGAQLPTLPLVGRAGSIAIAAYVFGKGRGGVIADVGRAAAVIAGYQFGTTGKISGIAPQIAGVAAQV
jgi:hypothetical protein